MEANRRLNRPLRSIADTPGTVAPMLRLAVPVLMEQFLNLLVVLSDTRLTGHHLGPSHLAAIGMISYVMWLIPSLFMAPAIGATALVARSWGARDFELGRNVTQQALLLGLLLTGVVMAVVLLQAEALVRAMQLDPAAIPLAVRYLQIAALAMPGIMLTQIGPACLRGAGDTVSGMITMGLVNVINVIASWSLTLGWWGLPEMGWEGVALGTALGYGAGGCIMLGLLLRGRAGLQLRWRALRPDRALILRILRIGVPAGSDMLLVVGCHMWFVSIINQLGVSASAAHGVAVRIEALAYLPGAAFQVAAATLTGQFLGAGDQRRAARSVLITLLFGGGLMTAAGVFMWLAADPLVKLFVGADKLEIVAEAAPLLRIVSWTMPALATMTILAGALRGAGDTRVPFLFTIVGLLGVRIPCAYLLTQYFEFGVQGAWYAMVADIFVRCPLVLFRFWQGGWKRIEV